ncbi:MAG: hypothetical protein WCC74_00470 [Minisyncoccia bacterium]
MLRLLLPFLAEIEVLFVSPKLGRIIPIQRGKNVVNYFANTKGLNRVVNEENGNVESEGEPGYLGLFWDIYGVRWIGLNTVYHYKLKLWMIGESGNLEETEVDAGSLYLFGTYLVPIPEERTREGVAIKLVLRVNTETVHAGISLGSPNWLAKTMDAVKSAGRDFIGHSTAEDFFSKIQVESGNREDPESLAKRMIDLNIDKVGYLGLPHTTGQKIVSINLVSIGMDEVFRKTLQAKLIAQKDGEAAVMKAEKIAEAVRKTAEGTLFSKQKEAEGNLAIGMSNITVVKGLVAAYGGPEHSTAVLQAEKLAELKGTLVSGREIVAQLPLKETENKTPEKETK